MKPWCACSGITRHACTQLWATSARSNLNSSGMATPKQSQADGDSGTETGHGKAGKQNALSNFPTATATTNYNQLWGTDSEGKVRYWLVAGSTPTIKRAACMTLS